MLEIKNLTYAYNSAATPVLNDVSVSMGGGGVYGLLGANGEGKSTLLYLIMGVLKPRDGSVTWDGTPTANRRPSTLSEIFLVPEELSLPDMDIMHYARLNASLYPRFSYEDLDKYMRLFNCNDKLTFNSMSMGQRKKAFIAYALAANTPLLLMDEPTNGLDIPGKGEFRRVIAESDNNRRTIVISTHQVRDLDNVLTHVVMLANHRILLKNSLRDIEQRFVFEFVNTVPESTDIIYSEPVPGGYQIVRRRTPDCAPILPDAFPQVNLESMFNLAYNNPGAFISNL